jgi:hypothetical protein
MAESLSDLVAKELSLPVDPPVTAMAGAIAARHGKASSAVLFYGSCLRQKRLEGLMLDFYLLVTDYRDAYDRKWLAAANRLIPPNVFYFERDGLVAKYAVMTEEDFDRECGPQARSTSVVARFAQPSRLVWSAGKRARERVIDSISKCAPTLLAWARPLARKSADATDLWKRAFQLTFGAELRAERSDRSAAIVDADPERYRRFAAATLAEPPAQVGEEAGRWWKRMQRRGKLLSALRLAKASATFAGGADYIAWKINRHAGTKIELKAWQRRHPLLAGITLLPRLLRSGAVR